MSGQKIAFSVIMPTCNRAHCVCTAIESVLRQTFRDFELIVADDGSSDGTVEMLGRRYAREVAERRIRILELPHAGVGAARNAALAEASNAWIAYLDSDSVAAPDFLQTFADGIAMHPADLNFYAAQRGRGGWELSFSHREIIYLPLTISLFPNYSTTQLLEFRETVGQACQRSQTGVCKEPRRASKPPIKAQYSDGLSDGKGNFKIISERLPS